MLEDVVILIPLAPDLRRHAVEPLPAVFRARNAAIAVTR
jgi:hypothetical protein